ncbi:hypothetical protein [Winogradskyella jejuensis]|uniref:Uncharacterized protein n=1 Tax=Winogradskyella jejuensis TaxID=1089305 RepID=A0A1M5T3U5_9FLAO|nr:hypothetical protein [Winogradskyella jejuensis]SHH45424.1 hypothetical protein SAMN05444148_2053 [Winogradskyella jejuensis]
MGRKRSKGYFVFTIILCLFMWSCPLMTPAPHGHVYRPLGNYEINNVQVFCTPKVKVFHVFYPEDNEVEVCSKVFVTDSCSALQTGEFFDELKYMKNVRMNDRKFHRLFFSDTLQIAINNSFEKLLFIPVE